MKKIMIAFIGLIQTGAEPFPKCIGCTAFVTVIREFIGAGTGIFIALSDSDVSGIGRRLVGCDGKAVEL